MLSAYSPDQVIYFGQHFDWAHVDQGYVSGGAGYVLSKEAVKRFWKRRPGLCDPGEDTGTGAY